MKDRAAKLGLARTIIETLGETYRRKKSELNSAEKNLYEAALRVGMSELMPRGRKREALAKFDGELAEQRARAEAARAARAKQREAGHEQRGVEEERAGGEAIDREH